MLGISETWLHSLVNDNLISHSEYNIIRADRQSGKRGGGLCCYVNKNLSYKENNDVICNIDCELMSVQIERRNQKNVLVVVVYRPPKGNTTRFIEQIRTYLYNNYKEQYMDLLIFGDFNIDMLNEKHTDVKKVQGLMSAFSLSQKVNEYTRIEKDCKSLLDPILTNIKYVQSAKAYNINLSDHFPVVLVYKKSRESNIRNTITCRSFNNENIASFRERVENTNWLDMLAIEDPNTMWEKMFSKFIDILNDTCPLRTFTVTRDRPTYISHEIIMLGKERDKLFKIARKSNLDTDWLAARRQRQVVNYAIRKAKSCFFKEKLNKCKGDSKKFWATVKQIIPDIRPKNVDKIVEKSSGTELTATNASNYINEFFCNIGDKLVDKLPKIDVTLETSIEHTTINYPWIGNLTEQMVKDEINRLDNNKSSGFQEINTRCLKICLLGCLHEFTILLNKCIDLAIFPNKWKVAIVTPILKQGDPTDVENLRPISLIPITGKILETFMNRFLTEHMEINNLFYTKQRGFRKNHSTIKTAFHLINYIQNNRNNNNYVATVYIDLKKSI